MLWRALKLLFRAVWGFLGLLGLAVTIDTGWSPFAKDVKETGVLGWIISAWETLVGLLMNNLLNCLILVVSLAILSLLLVDRGKQASKAQFDAGRKGNSKKKPSSKKAPRKK